MARSWKQGAFLVLLAQSGAGAKVTLTDGVLCQDYCKMFCASVISCMLQERMSLQFNCC